MSVQSCRLIELKKVINSKGSLVVGESGQELPFKMERFFYIFGVNANVIRGGHANLSSSFFMISVEGSCEVTVDNGECKQDFKLNKRETGLFISPMTWKVMKNFSEDCILLVFSDKAYDNEEYINDYVEFSKRVRLARMQNEKENKKINK